MADTLKTAPQQIVDYYILAQTYMNGGYSGFTAGLDDLKDQAQKHLELAEPDDPHRGALQDLLSAVETLQHTAREAALAKDKEKIALYKTAAEQSVSSISQACEALKNSYAQEKLEELMEENGGELDEEALRKEARKWAETHFDKEFGPALKAIDAETQEKTAAQWIEEAKSHLGDNNYD